MWQIIVLLQALINGLICSAEDPFTVVWNVPSQRCDKTSPGISKTLDDYGIKYNSDKGFRGDKVVLIYPKQLGYYPHMADASDYDGLPQRALPNLPKHLEKVESDINEMIPDKDFSGYAVIDWEAWHPLWFKNKGVNKWEWHYEGSMDIVRAENKQLPEKEVKEKAKHQFEEAAKTYMLKTLEKAKELRPKGKWGFYLYPKCYINKGQPECSEKNSVNNDEISWLFKASSALYPSIYIKSGTVDSKNFIHGQIKETQRILKAYCKPGTATMAYTLYQKMDSKFYTKEELANSIKQCKDMGMSGVIYWGRSEEIANQDSCKTLNNYITGAGEVAFGDFVKQQIDDASACSKCLCHGQGRCAAKNSNAGLKSRTAGLLALFTSQRRYKKATGNCAQYTKDDYECQCFAGFKGTFCK